MIFIFVIFLSTLFLRMRDSEWLRNLRNYTILYINRMFAQLRLYRAAAPGDRCTAGAWPTVDRYKKRHQQYNIQSLAPSASWPVFGECRIYIHA